MVKSSAAPFEFVSVDPASNLKPGKSLQIRSRCMQGKNKRAGSRRTRRKDEKTPQDAVEPTTGIMKQEPILMRVPPPNTLLSDLALVRFAGPGINSEDKGILFKAFAYNFANQALSPLDRCVDFDCLESASFEWAFSDTAFLHSVLCTSHAISDFMSPQWDGNPGRKTLFHLRETLKLLQKKMDQRNAHLDEVVLLVVINLALLSAIYGDWWAAAAHYKGLYKIVELRGNLPYLQARPKLHFKLDRIDLAYSLSSGKKPYFLYPQIAWDRIIPQPYSPLPTDLYHPPADWDYRLANVFHDFQFLSLKINRNALRRARHDPACFQFILTSLQSRLVHLGDVVQSPLEELVRLSMLALLTTTFKTPGRKIPYGWAIKRLDEVYREVADNWFNYDATLRLWILMSVTFTITGSRAAWVREAWRTVESGMVWEDVKSRLTRIMWIEIIHDKPGEATFNELEDSKSS